MTLFIKKGLRCNYLKMRLSWTIQVDPGPNDIFPHKRQKRKETEGHACEDRRRLELCSKKHIEKPEARKKQEKFFKTQIYCIVLYAVTH